MVRLHFLRVPITRREGHLDQSYVSQLGEGLSLSSHNQVLPRSMGGGGGGAPLLFSRQNIFDPAPWLQPTEETMPS